jgi:hypothetical protein
MAGDRNPGDDPEHSLTALIHRDRTCPRFCSSRP